MLDECCRKAARRFADQSQEIGSAIGKNTLQRSIANSNISCTLGDLTSYFFERHLYKAPWQLCSCTNSTYSTESRGSFHRGSFRWPNTYTAQNAQICSSPQFCLTFDSVKHESLWKLPEVEGIPFNFTNIVHTAIHLVTHQRERWWISGIHRLNPTAPSTGPERISYQRNSSHFWS